MKTKLLPEDGTAPGQTFEGGSMWDLPTPALVGELRVAGRGMSL